MRNMSSRKTPVSAAARGRVHPLMVITILIVLLPITWHVGTLFMTPLRTLYIFTVPVLGVIWLRGGMGPKLVGDWLLLAYILWMVISMGRHTPSQMITFSASTGLIILGGYLTARYTVRNAADFIAFARFLALVVVVLLLPLGLYEALGHNRPLVTDFLSRIFAGNSVFGTYGASEYCCRLGMARAQTLFVHPIHHGIACFLPFALYFTGGSNHYSFSNRALVASLLAVAVFTSVTSGAVLAIGLMGMLMLYTMVLHKNPDQWRIFLWTTLAVYIALEIISTKFVFVAISENLAFNTWNVYIRGLIFNAGIEQIRQTPIFGFGYNRLPGLPHYLTGSVDNYWLMQAVAFGVPGFLLPFAAFLHAIVFAGRNRFTKGSDLYYVRLAYGFTLTALVFAMATVHVWAGVQSLIFMVLGTGQFLFTVQEQAAQDPSPVQPRAPGPVYTRFPAARPGGMAAVGRAQMFSRLSATDGPRNSVASVGPRGASRTSNRRPHRVIGPSNTR